MRNAARFLACAIIACFAAMPTQAAESRFTPPPGYRPDLNSTEGGLWYAVDQIEKTVQQSPLLVRDEALNAYVKRLVCELAGDQCGSIRVYIVDLPYFNATAYPNGMVQVWTGLLLRAENEAQLAFVLGHELTHYLERHTLRQFESARDASGALAILSIAGAMVGVAGAGDLAGLLVLSALMSYSRGQESEADSGGFEIAVARGYEPRQAAAIWDRIGEEEKANPNRRREALFLSSHPTNDARKAAMNKLAEEYETRTDARDLGAGRYREAILAYRSKWLEAELNRAQYAESLIVIDRLLQVEPESGELQFYRGEAYRRRNGKGDMEVAISAYQSAIARGNAPAATHRSLGIAALRSGKPEIAREAFTNYLALAPESDDRAMVQLYLTNAGGQP